jgi:hypothetical protein
MKRFLCVLLCVGVYCGIVFRAEAQDIQVSSGVVCDTAEQIKMFGSLIDEAGSQQAMESVNEDAKDPIACVPATVAYFVVERGEVVKAEGKYWAVTKITVVGAVSGGRMQQFPPKDFYVLTQAPGQPA